MCKFLTLMFPCCTLYPHNYAHKNPCMWKVVRQSGFILRIIKSSMMSYFANLLLLFQIVQSMYCHSFLSALLALPYKGCLLEYVHRYNEFSAGLISSNAQWSVIF